MTDGALASQLPRQAHGIVEAPDENSAVAEAMKTFHITPARRFLNEKPRPTLVAGAEFGTFSDEPSHPVAGSASAGKQGAMSGVAPCVMRSEFRYSDGGSYRPLACGAL